MLVRKSFPLKVAALDGAGDKPGFRGLATVYNVVDFYGDILKPGLFSKSVRDSGGRFPLLWSHRMDEPIGSVAVESDNARSLDVNGSLLTKTVARAAETHSLMLEGIVKGLSVGFEPIRSTPMKNGGREHTEGRLIEVSLCVAPAIDSAEVFEVRDMSRMLGTLDKETLLAVRRSIDALLQPSGDDLASAFASFDPSKWK